LKIVLYNGFAECAYALSKFVGACTVQLIVVFTLLFVGLYILLCVIFLAYNKGPHVVLYSFIHDVTEKRTNLFSLTT